MSDNPYQTPATNATSECEAGAEGYHLMRSTSTIAWVTIIFLGLNLVYSSLVYLRYFVLVEHRPSESVGMVLAVSTVLSFCIWTHKSMVNAWVGGEPCPTINARSAVIWYFIPIAWFVMPFIAMKQIWQNCFGLQSSKALLISWWGCWLAMWGAWLIRMYFFNSVNYGDNFEFLMFLGLVVGLFKLLSGVYLMILVLKITHGQDRRIKVNDN